MSSLSKQSNVDTDRLLILLGSGIAFLIIFSFGIYRLLIGDMVMGLVDICVSAVLLLLFIQTVRYKSIEYINILLVLMYMGGVFTVTYLKGAEVLFWAYAAVSATYFLLPVRLALPMNIVFILATVPILLSKVPMTELLSFYATLVLVGVFGFIFSARTEHQQLKLFQLATMDSLTRVENRHSLDVKLNEVISTRSRIPLPTSILVLDLDLFKKINDTYGHVMGDKVLMHFADIIKSTKRVSDRLYRFGGEEFVVITHNTSLENAGKLAEKLRKAVEDDSMMKTYSATVSIGVAEICDDDCVDNLLNRADKALYKAKEVSRNVVCLADPLKEKNKYRYVPYGKGSKDIKLEQKTKPKENDTVVSIRTFRNGMI